MFELGSQNNLKVEHYFIDFTVFQLGQKLKSLNEEDKEDLKFQMKGLELARILAIKAGDLNFYKQETIQRIIDIQWTVSKRIIFCQS